MLRFGLSLFGAWRSYNWRFVCQIFVQSLWWGPSGAGVLNFVVMWSLLSLFRYRSNSFHSIFMLGTCRYRVLSVFVMWSLFSLLRFKSINLWIDHYVLSELGASLCDHWIFTSILYLSLWSMWSYSVRLSSFYCDQWDLQFSSLAWIASMCHVFMFLIFLCVVLVFNSVMYFGLEFYRHSNMTLCVPWMFPASISIFKYFCT